MSTTRPTIARHAGTGRASGATSPPHGGGMMIPSSTFATRHPYGFATLLTVTIVAAYLAAGTAAAVLDVPGDNTAPVFLAANLALVALGAALLTGLRWWRHVGFRALGAPRDLRLYWLPAALILIHLPFISGGVSVGRVGYFLLLAGAIGFLEEVFFRGLILRALAPRGLWRAVLGSSVLFGVLHALNVLAGANPIETALQVGYALAIGLGFAAVALRTRVLWPLVIIHALIDFTSFLAPAGAGAGGATTAGMVLSAVVTVAFTVYGIVMMRSVRPVSDEGGPSPATAAR